MEQPLSVLVISPHPTVQGGLSAFIELMKSRLTGDRIIPVWTGKWPGRHENSLGVLVRLVAAPVRIASLARRRSVDVVHLNVVLNPKSLVRDGLILAALRIVGFHRILVYFHGWDAETEHLLQRNWVLRHLFTGLLKGTSHILVLAPEFKTSLEQMGLDGTRIIVTRTMYDGTLLNNRPSTPPRRTILFMSRFDRRKGVYELLDAFTQIAGEFPDVDLVMAGDGDENAALRASAATSGLAERIFFPGYVGGSAKAKLLADCTLYALPTYYPEGMPVALLEAMGAGKPLLTTGAGGIRHIIAEPENGLVLKSVTADTVAAALRRMLADPQFCKETGQRNAAYAASRFEASTVTAEIRSIYQDIARTE